MTDTNAVKLRTRYRPGSTQELLVVALPLMASFGSQSLMYLADRIMLTWYSQAALAASMPAGLLNWTVMSLAYGVATYSGTFVAQYEGAGRKDRVAAVIWQAVGLSLLMGTGLALLALPSRWLFHQLGHPPDVREAEIIYFSTLICGAPATLLMTSLSGFFSGRNQTSIVLGVNLLAVVVNFVLDYLLIFGWGPIPRLGIFGAALATVISNLLSTVVYAVLIAVVGRWQNYPLRSARCFDPGLAWRMLRSGVPMGTQTFVDIAGFTVFSFVIGRVGTNELAATNLAFNLNSLAFIPMVGLGVGIMTLVGRRVGEGNPDLAEQSVRKGMYLGMIYMSLWCVAFVSFPRLLISPFSAFAADAQFAETEQIVVVLLRFIAVYSLFDALALVYGYAIRGAGDTWYPLLIFFLASLFCLILPTLWIARYWQGNVYACWGAATVYIMVIGVAMYLRYRQGRWKQMRLIEPEAKLAGTPVELREKSPFPH